MQRDTTASVEVTHYDARSIELQTKRSAPGYLVLSEIYYPEGWQLTIDGEPSEIYKTNYVLRGMNVPAGEHTLRMEFNPTSYIWGGRIAWGFQYYPMEYWVVCAGDVVSQERFSTRKNLRKNRDVV
ncbi:MAG: YfhO family protein [Balneolaceae bacterium]|nr:YfhO family protein [Balneolaceae bacterium]